MEATFQIPTKPSFLPVGEKESGKEKEISFLISSASPHGASAPAPDILLAHSPVYPCLSDFGEPRTGLEFLNTV